MADKRKFLFTETLQLLKEGTIDLETLDFKKKPKKLMNLGNDY